MKLILKKYGYFTALGLIFLLGFLLRLKWLLANPSFWNDECSLAWNVVDKSYGDFFSVLDFTQVAPPFFMIMAKLMTKIFGVSDFVLRITPFLFGAGSMTLFFLLSRRIFCKKHTILVSNFIFAINQTMINYSSEFKQYSCDVFFTLLCTYIFIDLFSENKTYKKILIYSFILCVSLWFSFVSIFAIAAGLFVLLLKQLKDKSLEIKKYLSLSIPIILNSLFYLFFYILNTYNYNIVELNKYWQNSYIAKDFSNFFILTKSLLSYFLFPSTLLLFIFIAVVIGALIVLKKKPFAGILFLLTFIFECLASWLGFYPFEKRVVLFLLPTALLFMSANFELMNSKRKFLSTIIVTTFFLIFSQSMIDNYNYLKTVNMSRGYYSRQLTKELSEKIKPGDIIVVNRYSKTDLAYYSTYYKIKNKVVIEGKSSDRLGFLNSLPRGHYYWFYLPFGISPTYDKWMYSDKNVVLYEQRGNVFSKLTYLYAK